MAATAVARAAIKLWYYAAYVCACLVCAVVCTRVLAGGCVRACVVCAFAYVRVGTCRRILPQAHGVCARG